MGEGRTGRKGQRRQHVRRAALAAPLPARGAGKATDAGGSGQPALAWTIRRPALGRLPQASSAQAVVRYFHPPVTMLTAITARH